MARLVKAATGADMDNEEIINSTLNASLGIPGLGRWILSLKNQGISEGQIVQMLRYGTDPSPAGQQAHANYLKAFPRIDTYIKDNTFAGDNPELQYIEYRNTVRTAAKQFGIMEDLLTDTKIADYISGKNSAAGLVDRMRMAASAVATVPTETLTALQDYYGVAQNDLISFYLDPDTTQAAIENRYTAAQIGGQAMKQQFNVTAQEAENLAKQGMSAADATGAFATAKQQENFMGGPGETATREDILGNISGDVNAQTKLRRIAESRAGQFAGGGDFLTQAGGVTGLGQSTTR